MRRFNQFLLYCCAAIPTVASPASADLISNVWTTGVAGASDGAFGTSGSVSGNRVSAEIVTGSITATVGLTASNANWLKVSGGQATGTNSQLVPFLENDAPLTRLAFTSDVPLTDFDVLVHNVWNATDAAVPGGQRTNFIGNFRVTYANGMVTQDALPTLRPINSDSPFAIDFENGTLQPTDLDDVFDGGNILTVSAADFDPGNGANPGYYWSDLSQSMMSEMQGFGIFSFDESNGGITDLEFSWVGNTTGLNTAFIGFAGKATPLSIPEPAGPLALTALAAASVCRRRAES